MKTTTMSPLLREALKDNGWNPDKITSWGRRVSGSPHGVTLERDGIQKWYAGPFASVQADGQVAIVRYF